MSNHNLLHTFTTHLPFSQITSSIKTNPVLYFNKTDYPKLNNPLGNARSQPVGIIFFKFTELQHTSATHFGIFHYPNFPKSNPVVTIDNLFVLTILEPLGNTYSIH